MLRPEGRTPVEVTAAAERTADLALRCVKLVSEREQARRERDEALAAIERVRVVRDDLYLAAVAHGMTEGPRKLIERLDAALGDGA